MIRLRLGGTVWQVVLYLYQHWTALLVQSWCGWVTGTAWFASLASSPGTR